MAIPMTVGGERALREELAHRKGGLRQEITQAIAEGRAHGDLKENAEYHAAREQQAFNEGRIQEIEGKLADAQVIDISKIPPGDKVIFGSTVSMIDVATDVAVTYQIVGEDEADVKDNKLSVMSPIGRALIGKSVGDEVTVVTPGGEHEYEIDRVEYI